jgi:hypothetical protein
VVERRFQLVPERSGTLTIPAAHFEGRGVGGFFDDMFGNTRRELRATRPAQTLQVRPMPDDAPQPWLPAHAAGVALPRGAADGARRGGRDGGRGGGADGGTGTQLPALELRAGDGAQVFAEPPQIDESFRDGRPQATVTRRFSVVPAQAGTLRVPGPVVEWWDVATGQRRSTRLPPLTLQVAPGQGGFATPPAAAGGGPVRRGR